MKINLDRMLCVKHKKKQYKNAAQFRVCSNYFVQLLKKLAADDFIEIVSHVYYAALLLLPLIEVLRQF